MKSRIDWDLCSIVRWARKSSVTWFGSPRGSAAQIGQTYFSKMKTSLFGIRHSMYIYINARFTGGVWEGACSFCLGWNKNIEILKPTASNQAKAILICV